jgi:peptide deformylase
LHEKLKPLTFPIPEQEQVFLERMKEYIDVSYNSEFKKYKITPGIAIAANQVG